MVSGQSVALEAVDLARNMERGYQLSVQRDLFGHFTIDQLWGRLGTKGQSRRVSFADQRSAKSFLRQVIKRCATAKRRNVVAYRVVGARSHSNQITGFKAGAPL